MRELLNAKVEQCSKFGTTLLKTEGKQIIEATHDMYWASGLPPYLSTTTKPECFSGENWLGHILECIRDELIRSMPSTSSSSMDMSDSAIEPTEEASHSTTAQPPMSTTAQSPPPPVSNIAQPPVSTAVQPPVLTTAQPLVSTTAAAQTTVSTTAQPSVLTTAAQPPPRVDHCSTPPPPPPCRPLLSHMC